MAAQVSKDTVVVTPGNLSSNNPQEKASSTPIHSARLANNKKFKSISESNAAGPGLKSNRLKGTIQQQE